MLRRISSQINPLFQSSRSSFLTLDQVRGFSIEVPHFIAFVLGGPGSGKGTQCAKIVEKYGFTHLSAGDLLRNEISSGSVNGSMILEIIKEGKIVPSEVTVKLIQKAIRSGENHKYLIDGFPRTADNRLVYERIIGAPPNLVLFFDCPEEEMVTQVLNRDEGRVDDNEETIKKRLKVFRELILPVIDYYLKKGILHKVNAIGTENDIFEQVCATFSAYEGGFFFGGGSYLNPATLQGPGDFPRSFIWSIDCLSSSMESPMFSMQSLMMLASYLLRPFRWDSLVTVEVADLAAVRVAVRAKVASFRLSQTIFEASGRQVLRQRGGKDLLP